jgi:phosphatidylglycerophosphatase A
MSETTDAPRPESAAPAEASVAAAKPAARKPRVALFIATACGLGYIPFAPGTWGSLLGVALYAALAAPRSFMRIISVSDGQAAIVVMHVSHPLALTCALALMIAFVGLWASGITATYSGKKDPQFVVVDEVSGQFLAYLLVWPLANWKYLLVGFILFRAFDIWKPFPARQAESLPGGWGIMADDWIAGVYAGIGLWIARAAGL